MDNTYPSAHVLQYVEPHSLQLSHLHFTHLAESACVLDVDVAVPRVVDEKKNALDEAEVPDTRLSSDTHMPLGLKLELVVQSGNVVPDVPQRLSVGYSVVSGFEPEARVFH